MTLGVANKTNDTKEGRNVSPGGRKVRNLTVVSKKNAVASGQEGKSPSTEHDSVVV